MKQLSLYFADPLNPQPLERHQLHWCRTVLAKKLDIVPSGYYKLYPGSSEAIITVNHAGVMSHPRRDDILRHAADNWYPTNDGGVVTQIDENTFHVSTFHDD